MIKVSDILQTADTITKINMLTSKSDYLSAELNDFTHKYANMINNLIDINTLLNDVKQKNSVSELTHTQIISLANTITERDELLESALTFEDEYLTMIREYANVLNEKYDLELKLKEVGL